MPTDFSPPSFKALQYASALAAEFGAKLHLLHVNELGVQEPLLASAFRLETDFGHHLRRRLQAIGAESTPRITPARCHVRSGRIDRQICREARILPADLIVLATHGYRGLKHIMLGSTAEKVVRRAPCPVLIVRQREREFVSTRKGARLRVGHILVPTDFSANSRRALECAIEFARRVGARLTLVHMIYPPYYVTNTDYLPYDFGSLLDETRRSARKEMAELVRTTSFRGVPCKTQIADGHPAEYLVELAADGRADLIVTSTHGRTGLKQALMGSIAEQIVRYAKSPVMVVPRVKSEG